MESLFDLEERNRLARGIDSQDYIAEEELFSDDFISTCTRYEHLHELIEAFLTVKLPYVFNTLFEGDRTLNHILDFFDESEIWDEFIEYNTIFQDWNAFYNAAVQLYYAKTECADILHRFTGLKYSNNAIKGSFTLKHEYSPPQIPTSEDYY